MTAQPDGGRRLVVVSVRGVAEVDPAWAAWLPEDETGERDEQLVDVHRGTTS